MKSWLQLCMVHNITRQAHLYIALTHFVLIIAVTITSKFFSVDISMWPILSQRTLSEIWLKDLLDLLVDGLPLLQGGFL